MYHSHLDFGLTQHSFVSHMFNSWLTGLAKDVKPLVLLGVVAICWSICLNINDMVFEKKRTTSPLQVIFAVSHWLLTWSILQKLNLQVLIVEASRHLVQVATDFFP